MGMGITGDMAGVARRSARDGTRLGDTMARPGRFMPPPTSDSAAAQNGTGIAGAFGGTRDCAAGFALVARSAPARYLRLGGLASHNTAPATPIFRPY